MLRSGSRRNFTMIKAGSLAILILLGLAAEATSRASESGFPDLEPRIDRVYH